MLTWEELTEVLLDIEVTLNNCPLSYLEDDVQLPTLTPNSFLFTNSNILPELAPYHLDERDLRKRAKFLLKTKDAMWRRWTSEYLRALRKRHRLQYGNAESRLAVGDVVIIKSVDHNRNCWPLGIIEELIVGRDQVVRGTKLRVGKSILERPVQHLYPLELVCDRNPPADKPALLDLGHRYFDPGEMLQQQLIYVSRRLFGLKTNIERI